MPNELMYSQRLVQLIPEVTPGTYNALANPIIIPGLVVEQQPEQAFATLRAQGYNVDTCHYIAREHSVISGTLELDYRTIDAILKMALGAAVSDTTSGGTISGNDTTGAVRTIIFQNTLTGPRNVQTYTLEYGTFASCDRCPYALLQSIKFESNRLTGDKVSGNVTFIAQKPVAEGAAMTGSTAQSAAFNLVETNALPGVNGVFALNVPGSNPVDFTVHPGDSNSTVQTAVQNALNAIPGISGANVTVVNGPVTNPAYSVNNIAFTAQSGTFVLTVGTHSTGALAANAGATAVAAALNVLPEVIAAGLVSVAVGAGSISGGGPWTADYRITGMVPGPLVVTCTTSGFTASNDTVGVAVGTTTLTVSVGTVPINTPIDVRLVSGVGWSTVNTALGGNGSPPIPNKWPVITKNMSGRRSSTHTSLASASQIDRHLMTSLELNGLVDPVFYFSENVTTYVSHVDGDQQQQIFTIQLSKASADEPALFDAARGNNLNSDNPNGDGQVSTAQWFNTRFVHPDTKHQIDFDIYASAHAVANQQAAGKVWARTFPMAVEQAPDEPYAIQATVVMPG